MSPSKSVGAIAAMAFLAMGQVCSAQSLCPDPFLDTILPSASGSGGLDKSHIAVGKITIGAATLEEVQEAFGSSTQFRLSSEEESQIGVCYEDRKESSAVIFAAGMSGSWKVVDSIYLGRVKDFVARGAKCSPSKVLSVIATNSGIRSGMTVAALCKAFPASCNLTEGSVRQFVLEHPVGDSGSVRTSAVTYAVADNKICWIELYQGESN
jgi:hypothetical protein